ncbi:MAG TPA: hypothetical protein PLH23_13280 [Hyphomonadaceae bacterium]|nr:hypothetical protein [Hyphomonadaceae bacterium]
MTRIFAAGLAFTVSMCALTACDNNAPSAPVESVVAEPAAPVAAAVTPAPTVSSVLADVDVKALCALFNRAAATKAEKVTAINCVAEPASSAVALSITGGSLKLSAPLAVAGAKIPMTSDTVSSNAVEDKIHAGWSNIGAVFVGRAPDAGMCMEVEYFAPNGKSDSLFVARAGEKEAIAFSLVSNPEALQTLRFEEPVIAAGKTSSFALTRREPGVVVKSVTFMSCK